MSLEAVIAYFSQYNMDHRVMVPAHSTATVQEEALEHTGHAVGDAFSSIRLTIAELEAHSHCKAWVDVCKYD